MSVSVDQARQNVLACRIDLDVTRDSLGPSGFQSHWIGADDIRDPVIFDHDVFGTRGRCTVAVDKHRVSDDQAGVALCSNGGLVLAPRFGGWDQETQGYRGEGNDSQPRCDISGCDFGGHWLMSKRRQVAALQNSGAISFASDSL